MSDHEHDEGEGIANGTITIRRVYYPDAPEEDRHRIFLEIDGITGIEDQVGTLECAKFSLIMGGDDE